MVTIFLCIFSHILKQVFGCRCGKTKCLLPSTTCKLHLVLHHCSHNLGQKVQRYVINNNLLWWNKILTVEWSHVVMMNDFRHIYIQPGSQNLSFKSFDSIKVSYPSNVPENSHHNLFGSLTFTMPFHGLAFCFRSIMMQDDARKVYFLSS